MMQFLAGGGGGSKCLLNYRLISDTYDILCSWIIIFSLLGIFPAKEIHHHTR